MSKKIKRGSTPIQIESRVNSPLSPIIDVMALSPTQRTFLEPDPASFQDSISVNPLSLYDRRGSKNSYASSSARSHGADSRASDGFYTPTYISSSEFRASRISNPRTSASNQGSQDHHQPNPISPRSQGSFQKDSSSPFMPVRKPKAEVNLFPVDVEDEETEDDAHTPLPLATPVSPRSSPLADWPQSPEDTTPNSQAASAEGERSYGYPFDSYKHSWEIEATPSKMPVDPRTDASVISPYMASFISVEEPTPSNHAFDPSHDLQSSRQDNIEQQKNTQSTLIIPKRRTSSRSGGPETPSLQNVRNTKVGHDSLDRALETIDHIYDSAISPVSSPDSMPKGNGITFGAQNSASVSDIEFVSDDRKETRTPRSYPNGLTSDSTNLIAFPGVNAPTTFEQENKYLPVQSTNLSNSEVAPAFTTTPRSPFSKASVALQKLGNFRSNVFGSSTQKTDSAPSNLTSGSGKEVYSMTSSSSALALSGLPDSYQTSMNENIEINGNDTKNHYPPSSSKNPNGSSALERSIGGSQSVDGNIGGGNHSTGLSSIKGRLRTLSGSLRRMNSKSDRSNIDGGRQGFNEGPKEQESGSPLMHAILPSARQSALTLASLAAKKASSPTISTSHLTTSSDIQSEILRPEDAAMPFIASQRFLRPATSPGIQRGPQMSSSSETRTSSGWSAPFTEETDNSSSLRPTLNTIANTPSSSSSVPTLNSIKRKPVPNLDPTARPRTASPAMTESNSLPQTLSVGKAPRLRNAMSSTALNIPTNAKEHNASVPAVLVPSNFGPQKRSSAVSQFGPAYPRRRSSSASQQQNVTPPILIRTTKNSEDEPVSPLTKSRQLMEDAVDHQSSVDTVTQPTRMPRRGSTSSNRKPVPTSLNLAGNNATSEITYDTANRTRTSLGAEGHSMPRKSSTTSNTNFSFNDFSITAGGGNGSTSVQPLSPRSLGIWQGYKHSNVSVESNGSPLNTNVRLRTAPEAQRPSIVSLTGSQSGFGAQSGSSQEHSSHIYSTQNRQQRGSRSSGAGIDSGLQTYLNEEDYQIVEDEPVVVKDLNLASIRHRVAPEFVNTGSRWTNPHRPLSIRSRRMSSETLRDDAQSMYDGSISTINGEQGEMGKKSVLLGSDKEQKKRKGALEAREKELTVEALSKAEMAYAHIDIWTESRRGKWIVKGPAPDDAYPADQLPDISDPWVIPIDAKGIVRRKKLKSNIELSSTKTIIICPDCREAAHLNIAHNCSTCHGSERVETVYTVQCVVRMAQFLPLKLPAALLLGTKQPHIKYIDAADPDHRTDILRDRALEGLQSSAARVIRVHNVQHGSRLLMGRVKITRIGVLTVSVHSAKSKIARLFDVEDGPNGQINEVTHLASTSNGRASVMSNGTSSNRASFSRKGSSAGLSVDHMPLPDDMDSVKSGKTNKSRGASSLFYSLSGANASSGRKKKNGFGNASSPNLIQSAYQNNPESVPALPDHENLDAFGRTHKRNNLSVSDPNPILDGQTQLQSSLYTSNASKINGKRSLKSLFRHH